MTQKIESQAQSLTADDLNAMNICDDVVDCAVTCNDEPKTDSQDSAKCLAKITAPADRGAWNKIKSNWTDKPIVRYQIAVNVEGKPIVFQFTPQQLDQIVSHLKEASTSTATEKKYSLSGEVATVLGENLETFKNYMGYLKANHLTTAGSKDLEEAKARFKQNFLTYAFFTKSEKGSEYFAVADKGNIDSEINHLANTAIFQMEQAAKAPEAAPVADPAATDSVLETEAPVEKPVDAKSAPATSKQIAALQQEIQRLSNQIEALKKEKSNPENQNPKAQGEYDKVLKDLEEIKSLVSDLRDSRFTWDMVLAGVIAVGGLLTWYLTHEKNITNEKNRKALVNQINQLKEDLATQKNELEAEIARQVAAAKTETEVELTKKIDASGREFQTKIDGAKAELEGKIEAASKEDLKTTISRFQTTVDQLTTDFDAIKKDSFDYVLKELKALISESPEDALKEAIEAAYSSHFQQVLKKFSDEAVKILKTVEVEVASIKSVAHFSPEAGAVVAELSALKEKFEGRIKLISLQLGVIEKKKAEIEKYIESLKTKIAGEKAGSLEGLYQAAAVDAAKAEIEAELQKMRDVVADGQRIGAELSQLEIQARASTSVIAARAEQVDSTANIVKSTAQEVEAERKRVLTPGRGIPTMSEAPAPEATPARDSGIRLSATEHPAVVVAEGSAADEKSGPVQEITDRDIESKEPPSGARVRSEAVPVTAEPAPICEPPLDRSPTPPAPAETLSDAEIDRIINRATHYGFDVIGNKPADLSQEPFETETKTPVSLEIPREEAVDPSKGALPEAAPAESAKAPAIPVETASAEAAESVPEITQPLPKAADKTGTQPGMPRHTPPPVPARSRAQELSALLQGSAPSADSRATSAPRVPATLEEKVLVKIESFTDNMTPEQKVGALTANIGEPRKLELLKIIDAVLDSDDIRSDSRIVDKFTKLELLVELVKNLAKKEELIRDTSIRPSHAARDIDRPVRNQQEKDDKGHGEQVEKLRAKEVILALMKVKPDKIAVVHNGTVRSRHEADLRVRGEIDPKPKTGRAAVIEGVLKSMTERPHK